MKRATAVVFSLLLPALASIAGATDNTTTAPTRETGFAKRHILVNEGLVKVGGTTLQSIAQSEAIEAIRPDISIAPTNPAHPAVEQSLAGIVNVTWANDPLGLVITVDLANVDQISPKRAAEAADAAVKAVAASYHEAEREPLEQLQQQLDQLNRKREDLRDQVQEAANQQRAVSDAVRKEAGLADASSEGVHAIAQKLEAESESAQLELKAKTARHEALAEAIAKLSAQAEAKGNDDPVAAELAKVVEAREKNVARKRQMVEQKTASNAEVDEAIGAAAEARAKWLERKMTASAAAGGDAVAAWNKELLSLSIDLAELKARGEALDARLKQVSQALTVFDQRASPQSLQQRIDEATRQLRDVENQMSDVSRRLQPENRARVTVVESSDEPVTPKR